MAPKKIIIDTDIGDDIDDALAISYALNSPEVEVVGLTTVFKNVEYRTQLALRLLKTYNSLFVPVASGIGKPIINEVNHNEIPCQYDESEFFVDNNCQEDAVDFILNKVKEDSSIKIVAIGPLTNIAAAIIKDEMTMKKAGIILMGGMYSKAYPEWNILCDPEAANIVFSSEVPVTMVGLDVTLKCRLADEHLNIIKESTNSQAKYLYKLTRMWMEKSGHLPILHDPLAIAYVIDPTLFSVENKSIMVECIGQYTRGMTIEQLDVFWNRRKPSNVKVCVDVDSKKFIKLFLNRMFTN